MLAAHFRRADGGREGYHSCRTCWPICRERNGVILLRVLALLIMYHDRIVEIGSPIFNRVGVIFIAFDVFFAIFCVVLACLIDIALCCCLPCIIAIVYAVAGQVPDLGGFVVTGDD
ncbi:hypothetical protein RYX36_005363 [Vicia faba]